jgi:hypothetical protein
MSDATPDCVYRWLRVNLEIHPPGHSERPVLERLAYDKRMAALWDQDEAGCWPWPAQVMLMENAFFFARDPVLGALLLPPERRIYFAVGQYALWAASKTLLKAIADYPDDAERLLTGADWLTVDIDPAPLRELVSRLRAFAERARRECEVFRGAFDHLPPPSSRGRGSPLRTAYCAALDSALPSLPYVKITQTQRDRIVALLTSVVFGRDIDAETVTRARQRRRPRPDNSG